MEDESFEVEVVEYLADGLSSDLQVAAIAHLDKDGGVHEEVQHEGVPDVCQQHAPGGPQQYIACHILMLQGGAPRGLSWPVSISGLDLQQYFRCLVLLLGFRPEGPTERLSTI